MAGLFAAPLISAACSADSPAGGFSNAPPTGGAGGNLSTPVTGGSTQVPSTGGAISTGGAPAAPGGMPAASGGAPPQDPNSFDWPEATADGGAARLCKPGHYVGTYQCTVTGPMGAPAVGLPLTGPVDLRLSQAQEGEFLVVSGGTLKTSAGVLQLDAGVIGKLNCQTGKFEGTLENGQLSVPPFPPGGTVGGTLVGAFVPATPALEGTWDLEAGTAFPGYGCEGPWTITWVEE